MASQSAPLTPTITASTNNISRDSLDCGIKVLGWCRSENFQKLAKLRYFLPIFLFIGALHGASETYFRISTKQTTLFEDFDSQIVDWLLVSSYIFQALLAFIIGFWSQQYHPISWLGGLTIFQSVFCFLSVIPTLTQFDFDISSGKYDNSTPICRTSKINMNLTNENSDYIITKLVMLFLIQFSIGLGYTAFYTIGIPYIDNNSNIEDAPAIFGSILSIHIWGYLIGCGLTFIADISYLNWWFGWIIIGPLLLILGSLIALFPRKLLRIVLKQAAQRIIDGTSRNNLNDMNRLRTIQYLDDVNFVPSLKRLLTNKILLLNLCGLIFIKIGILNFNLNEQNYLQSRFYFPTDENNGIMDEWLSRLLSYLLKPPIVGTCMLVTGLLISKLKPSARHLSMWNIISGSFIVIIFISYIFIDCSNSTTLAGVRKGVITQPYCSRECICSAKNLIFSPVCPEKSHQTYFSPCHAGCKNQVSLNDITIYENCTCGSNTEYHLSSMTKATQGACNMKECQTKWIIFQVLEAIVAAFFGTILICNLMITLRSVLDQDKSLALSLELFLSGIMVYVVGKLIYDTVAVNTCAYWSFNYKKCLLQDSSLYGNILNFITITLIIVGVIFDIFVYIFADDLDLFTRNPPYDEEPFHFIPPLLNAPQRNATTDRNNNNNGNSTTEQQVLLSTENEQQEQQHEQQQQQEEHQQQQQLQSLQLPRIRPIRPISPSSSSESQISPITSSYRRGAIPKRRPQQQQQQQPQNQTVETDF